MKIHTPTDYENYEPIGDRILTTLPAEDVNQLENVKGVLVPRDHALKNNPLRESVVVAAGPDCKQAYKGCTVMWNKSVGGTGLPFGDVELFFIEEKYLTCITKKAPEFPKPVS